MRAVRKFKRKTVKNNNNNQNSFYLNLLHLLYGNSSLLPFNFIIFKNKNTCQNIYLCIHPYLYKLTFVDSFLINPHLLA